MRPIIYLHTSFSWLHANFPTWATEEVKKERQKQVSLQPAKSADGQQWTFCRQVKKNNDSVCKKPTKLVI